MLTLRSLTRTPGYTIPVLAMFALSIAANTAIFSIFNGLFLTALPFQDPHQLLYITESVPRLHIADIRLPYADLDAWRSATEALESIAAYKPDPDGANLTTSGDAIRVRATNVGYNMAATLGIRPLLGRDFLPSEDRKANVVLLTYPFWRRQFEGRPDVVGKIISLDDRAFTVIGVLPANAVFPGNTDIWMPLGAYFPGDQVRAFAAIARLKPGISIEQARADLMRIQPTIPKPFNQRGTEPVLTPLRERFVSGYRLVTGALLGAVAFILIIACINVGGLMLARGKARSQEFAIRGALGAGRGRLLRQLLGETLLLAFLGSAIGVALGWATLRWTISLIPEALPSWVTFPLDLRVLFFSIVTTAAAALLSGFAPAFQFSKVDFTGALVAKALSTTRNRAMNVLIVGEIAVAFVLLAAGRLMLKAFHHVLDTDPGFKPSSVLTFSLDPSIGAAQPARVHRFYDELLDRLRALPGVDSAGAVAAYNLPMNGQEMRRNVEVEGMAQPDPNQPHPSALLTQITPQYFRALGISIKSGRDFDDHDGATSGPTNRGYVSRPSNAGPIIVDEAFVRRFWPGELNVLGKQVTFGGNEWMTVVGVVETVRHDGLDRELRPGVYLPARLISQMTVIVRGSIDIAAVREIIRQLDSSTALFDVHTMEERVDRSLWMRRTYSSIFAGFAAIALLLSVAGIYGVVSYTVAQRTREIGIRMALGAKPAQVLSQVMWQGMSLVGIGFIAGVPAALFATRPLESLLVGISTHDTWTFLAVGVLLVTSAFAANLVPARRAALVDPIRALRNE